jgi:hypothetical protein
MFDTPRKREEEKMGRTIHDVDKEDLEGSHWWPPPRRFGLQKLRRAKLGAM